MTIKNTWKNLPFQNHWIKYIQGKVMKMLMCRWILEKCTIIRFFTKNITINPTHFGHCSIHFFFFLPAVCFRKSLALSHTMHKKEQEKCKKIWKTTHQNNFFTQTWIESVIHIIEIIVSFQYISRLSNILFSVFMVFGK